MTSFNFTCPFCNQPTTITDPNLFESWERIVIEDSKKGKVGFKIYAITCPNIHCNNLYLKVSLTDAQSTQWGWRFGKTLESWNLLPESQAKVLPEYVPTPIKEDYYEACRIRDLSPKASATLSRRCLQGMIRDFWKISKRTLKQEVDSLEEKVDKATWEAIDSVREVGNIGAHMEKDINTIIDVEPKEAQLLIELIETLVADWYVSNNDKNERLKKVKLLANLKTSMKDETNKIKNPNK